VFTTDKLSRISVGNSWTSADYSNDTALTAMNITSTDEASGFAISVESNGLMSYQKVFRYTRGFGNDTYGVTFPLLMAIINVDGGVVTGITWDDTCKWCDADMCAENTFDYTGAQLNSGANCFVRDSSCRIGGNSTVLNDASTVSASASTNATIEWYTPSSCQLNVYVVWTGTDSSGILFESVTARFSRLNTDQLIEFTKSL
jgi:hypothetical protein